MDLNSGLLAWLNIKRTGSRTPALGSRELAVLDILWRHDNLSAQQVLDKLSGQSISLSTVQSTLERLQRKAVVTRTKLSRTYLYSVNLRREDLICTLLQDITDEIAGGDMAPVVSGFMDYLEQSPAAGKTKPDHD